MQNTLKIGTILIVSIFISSCSLFRKGETDVATTISSVAATELYQKVIDNYSNFDRATIRFKAAIDIPGNKNNLGGVMRIRRDSAIWVSVTAAFGIEVVRVLMTPDSLKMLNRLGASYYAGNYEQVNKQFKLNLNYEAFQAILLNEMYLYPSGSVKNADELLSFGYYPDSTDLFLQRPTRKDMDSRLAAKDTANVVLQKLIFDPVSFKLTENFTQEYAQQRSLSIRYADFVTSDQGTLAYEIGILANTVQAASSVDLKYSKVTFDEILDFPFQIPDSYKPMK